MAAAPSLAAGWIVHRGAPDVPFAATAIADRVIRLAPGDVATAAIDRLHHAAQPLLAVAVAAALVAMGATIAWRLRSPAQAAVAWATTLFAAALAAPLGASFVGALAASAMGALTYGVALRAVRRARAPRTPDPARRRALILVGALTGGALIASHPLAQAVAWIAGRSRRPRTAALPHGTPPPRPPFPRIPGLADEITPTANHYVVDIDIDDPIVDGSAWRLRVHGLVDRELDLSFLDVQREFTLVDEVSALTCISNPVGGPLVGCSRWEGVPLGALLRRSGPKPGATGLAVRCADGYTAGIPLAATEHPSALLAIAQNGRALAREHGFPARLRVPSLYGCSTPSGWSRSRSSTIHSSATGLTRAGHRPRSCAPSRASTLRDARGRGSRPGSPEWHGRVPAASPASRSLPTACARGSPRACTGRCRHGRGRSGHSDGPRFAPATTSSPVARRTARARSRTPASALRIPPAPPGTTASPWPLPEAGRRASLRMRSCARF